MPRNARSCAIPFTPVERHLKCGNLSADEIEIDDEVTIKTSTFRENSEDEIKYSKTRSDKPLSRRRQKFILRKSTDLKKFKSTDDKINAILSSPMIEVRRKTMGRSTSLLSDESDLFHTPIRVPSSKDLMAVNSRRLSTALLGKLASNLPSTPSNGSRVSVSSQETPIRCLFNKRDDTPKDLVPSLVSSEDIPPWVSEAMDAGSENVSYEKFGQISEVEKSQEEVNTEPASVDEFRVLVNMQSSRLSAAKAAWEDVIAEENKFIPEIAANSIRAVVGKCGLLLSKKFPFFRSLMELVDACLQPQNHQNGDSKHSANVNDLLGVWYNIAKQIEDVDDAFERLRTWREVSGWALEARPVTPGHYNADVVGDKKKHDVTSRLPRATSSGCSGKALKLKFSGAQKPLKRLLGSAKKPMSSKLRAPKPVEVSKFSKFRAQCRAKKNVLNSKTTDNMDMNGQASEHGAIADFQISIDATITPVEVRNDELPLQIINETQDSTLSTPALVTGKVAPDDKTEKTPRICQNRLSFVNREKIVAASHCPLPKASSATPRRSIADKDVLVSADTFSVAPNNKRRSKIPLAQMNTITPRCGRSSITPRRSKAVEGDHGPVSITSDRVTINNTPPGNLKSQLFAVPDSRIRRFVRKETGARSTPRCIAIPNAFSPSHRPNTGTPRPQPLSGLANKTPSIDQPALMNKRASVVTNTNVTAKPPNSVGRGRKSLLPEAAVAAAAHSSTPNGGVVSNPRPPFSATPKSSRIIDPY